MSIWSIMAMPLSERSQNIWDGKVYLWLRSYQFRHRGVKHEHEKVHGGEQVEVAPHQVGHKERAALAEPEGLEGPSFKGRSLNGKGKICGYLQSCKPTSSRSGRGKWAK